MVRRYCSDPDLLFIIIVVVIVITAPLLCIYPALSFKNLRKMKRVLRNSLLVSRRLKFDQVLLKLAHARDDCYKRESPIH